jgi:hypothetical protein
MWDCVRGDPARRGVVPVNWSEILAIGMCIIILELQGIHIAQTIAVAHSVHPLDASPC